MPKVNVGQFVVFFLVWGWAGPWVVPGDVAAGRERRQRLRGYALRWVCMS